MNKNFPQKLKQGDEVRIIMSSRSLEIISKEQQEIVEKRLSTLGLKLSFGKHVHEIDDFSSTSIASRIEDLHDAFLDKNVKGIFTVIGGYNANQLLDYIDWDIIKNNPKVFCGFSDVTILNNAIYAKTGLVNYYGPHYSTFGQELHFDYTLEYFKKCIFLEPSFYLKASNEWSDDLWYLNQQDRKLIPNDNYIIINEGSALGTILGGNICTFNLLQGTKYFPDLTNTILFLEDDELTNPEIFDRDLQSLIHQPNFEKVKGLVIGRFQKISNVNKEILFKIIKTKKELNNIPVIANVDFGHTDPKITFPIGGEVEIIAQENKAEITITKH